MPVAYVLRPNYTKRDRKQSDGNGKHEKRVRDASEVRLRDNRQATKVKCHSSCLPAHHTPHH